jgi:hypothetical protein
MTLASLRDRASAPLEWTTAQIAARPKAALAVWMVSLALVAWMF